MKKTINSTASLIEFIKLVKELFNKHKYLTVRIDYKKRSIDQNALQFALYSQLEKQGDMKVNEYRRYCKYHFGCAIRAAKDSSFAEIMRTVLTALPYEQRLESMDFIDVTSTFNVEEMTMFIEQVIEHYTNQGFILDKGEQ